MKKTVSFLLILLLCPVCFCHAAEQNTSYVVLEAGGEQILEGMNENVPLPMASTTKIMTAVVILENTKLSEKVKITPASAGKEGSSMYLKAGQVATVEQLIYGLMLVSGNDAASALAIHAAGSEQEFAELMNQKAKQLSLVHTHFENPSGLPDKNHYTSALDLARLTAYALQNETFAKIVSTKSYVFNGNTLTNHNRLLREVEGCIGVKTGFTKDSGRCLVSAVKRQDVTLICVTLRCPDDWNRHKALYDRNFKRCKTDRVLDEKQIYLALRVAGGDSVGCYSLQTNGVIVDEQKKITYKIRLPQFVYPNMKKGRPVGKVDVYNGDVKIAEGDLVLDRDTQNKPAEQKSKFRKLLDFILHNFGF